MDGVTVFVVLEWDGLDECRGVEGPFLRLEAAQEHAALQQKYRSWGDGGRAFVVARWEGWQDGAAHGSCVAADALL